MTAIADRMSTKTKNLLIRVLCVLMVAYGVRVLIQRPHFSDDPGTQFFLTCGYGVFPVLGGALWFTRSRRLSGVAFLLCAVLLVLKGVTAVPLTEFPRTFSRSGWDAVGMVLVALFVVGVWVRIAMPAFRLARERLSEGSDGSDDSDGARPGAVPKDDLLT